jgi:Domain of unknown function (DUF1835)
MQAIHPKTGNVLVNDDVLSCGPLPPFRSPDQWTSLRGTYWDSVAPSDDPQPSVFNGDFLANALTLRDTDSIVLWIGVGAAEQLLLAWVVHPSAWILERGNEGGMVPHDCLNVPQRVGLPPDVNEFQLAYAERNDVRAAYNRAAKLPERRRMRQEWADYLERLRTGADVLLMERSA